MAILCGCLVCALPYTLRDDHSLCSEVRFSTPHKRSNSTATHGDLKKTKSTPGCLAHAVIGVLRVVQRWCQPMPTNPIQYIYIYVIHIGGTWGGVYSFVACLTIDYASLSRRNTVSTPN